MMNQEWPVAKVIAHRGANLLAPENTISAMRKAAALGAKWIEFDVELTADGEPVVIHDDTLDRTTNGRGLVSQTRLAAIQTLDAGSWFGEEFRNESLPTLAEWLLAAAECNLGINLEMKPVRRAKLMAREVIKNISRHWNKSLPPVLISSFSANCLREVRALDPQVMLAYNRHRNFRHWRKVCDLLNCVSLHIYHHHVTADFIKKIHDSGRKILVYTVNNPDRAKQLFEWGVDGIFSDNHQLY